MASGGCFRNLAPFSTDPQHLSHLSFSFSLSHWLQRCCTSASGFYWWSWEVQDGVIGYWPVDLFVGDCGLRDLDSKSLGEKKTVSHQDRFHCICDLQDWQGLTLGQQYERYIKLHNIVYIHKQIRAGEKCRLVQSQWWYCSVVLLCLSWHFYTKE